MHPFAMVYLTSLVWLAFGFVCAVGEIDCFFNQGEGQMAFKADQLPSNDLETHELANVRCFVPPNCHPTQPGCPKSTLVYSPVCGCDGVEYVNECVAKVLNCVPFVSAGPCPFGHPGPILLDSACDDCVVPLTCDPGGVACPLVYAPVCGCNGVTYGNRCEATVLNCVSCVTPGSCSTTLQPTPSASN